MIGLKQDIDLLDNVGGLSLNVDGFNITKLFTDDSTYFKNKVQEISVSNAQSKNDSYIINGQRYLYVSNYTNGNAGEDSYLYKWTDSTVGFELYQTFTESHSPNGIFFTVGLDVYLFVLTAEIGNDFTQDSTLYKWNGALFEEFQQIPTNAPIGGKTFTDNGEIYVLVSSNYNNAPSVLFKWSGVELIEEQSLPLARVEDVTVIEINNETYVNFSQYRNDASYQLPNKIYKMVNGVLEIFQDINVFGGNYSEFFTISGEFYLIINSERDNSSYNVPSRIFKWNGTLFVDYQTLENNLKTGALASKFFRTDGVDYLIVGTARTNYPFSKNLKGVLYRFKDGFFESIEKFDSWSISSFIFFTEGVKDYLYITQRESDTGFDKPAELWEFKRPPNEIVATDKTKPLIGGNTTESVIVPTQDLLNPFADDSALILMKFNDTLIEEKNSETLTAQGTNAFVQGVFGNAVYLGAESVDYVEGLDFEIMPDDTEHSMSMWVNPKNGADVMAGVHGLKDASNVGGGFGFGFEGGAVVSNLTVLDQGIFPNASNVYFGLTKTKSNGIAIKMEIPNDIFVHIAYTWDGSIFSVYKNGVLKASLPYTLGFKGNETGFPFKIGSTSSYYEGYRGTENSACDYEQIRLFNRALTPVEIQNIFVEEQK